MYGKIFDDIYCSSIAEDYLTRLVFMDLIVLSDDEGYIDKTQESIARITNVPLELVRNAITRLEQPDPRSRRTNQEGRRIVRLDAHRDWGWKIVNKEAWKSIASSEDRKIQNREAQRRHRTMSASVSNSKHKSAMSAHTDKDKDTDKEETTLSCSTSFRKDSCDVLAYLNQKAGRSYRAVDENIKLIMARLKSGATVEDCKRIVDLKTIQWGSDDKMREYLRPATLFGATKFEQYMGEIKPKEKERIVVTGRVWE